MAGSHGGHRDGSGRKPNSEKYADQVASFNELAARGLSQNFDNLCTLADGGYERFETEYTPAGVIFRKDVARDKDGEIVRDKHGKPILVQVAVFPDLPPDQMIPIKRKVITLGPDFRANEYLVNRIMGTPIPQESPEAETLDIRTALADAMAAVAARKARGPISNEKPPDPPPEDEGGGDDGPD
jgi:hypothetical protein